MKTERGRRQTAKRSADLEQERHSIALDGMIEHRPHRIVSHRVLLHRVMLLHHIALFDDMQPHRRQTHGLLLRPSALAKKSDLIHVFISHSLTPWKRGWHPFSFRFTLCSQREWSHNDKFLFLA
jgi:hypothetical protein